MKPWKFVAGNIICVIVSISVSRLLYISRCFVFGIFLFVKKMLINSGLGSRVLSNANQTVRVTSAFFQSAIYIHIYTWTYTDILTYIHAQTHT